MCYILSSGRLPGIQRGQGFIYGSHTDQKPASEPSLRQSRNMDRA